MMFGNFLHGYSFHRTKMAEEKKKYSIQQTPVLISSCDIQSVNSRIRNLQGVKCSFLAILITFFFMKYGRQRIFIGANGSLQENEKSWAVVLSISTSLSQNYLEMKWAWASGNQRFNWVREGYIVVISPWGFVRIVYLGKYREGTSWWIFLKCRFSKSTFFFSVSWATFSKKCFTTFWMCLVLCSPNLKFLWPLRLSH